MNAKVATTTAIPTPTTSTCRHVNLLGRPFAVSFVRCGVSALIPLVDSGANSGHLATPEQPADVARQARLGVRNFSEWTRSRCGGRLSALLRASSSDESRS